MRPGKSALFVLLFVFLLLAAPICPPDDDDDNNDATPDDDDTGDDDVDDDDLADDDVADDDLTDDDISDDDLMDDDDAVDDDAVDDDVTDDDVVDDDIVDDDVVDDDAVDDDVADDDTTAGEIWFYDFEGDEPGAFPPSWIGGGANGNRIAVIVTTDRNGQPTQALWMAHDAAAMNPDAPWAEGIYLFYQNPINVFHLGLDVDVKVHDDRSSRLYYFMSADDQHASLVLRFTATAGQVEVFLGNNTDPTREWLRCATFAPDQWQTVTVAIGETPDFDILLNGLPTSCRDIPLPLGFSGRLDSLKVSDAGDTRGFLHFDNFRLYRPAPSTTPADDDTVDDDAADDDIAPGTLAAIDGDSEFYPNNRVSLAIDGNDHLHLAYQKRDHYWYHACDYRNYYYANNTTGAWDPITLGVGGCLVLIDVYLDDHWEDYFGESSSLLLDDTNQPLLAYHWAEYYFSEGFHGFPDLEGNYSRLYYQAGGETTLVDEDEVETSSYYGLLSRSNALARDDTGQVHLAYIHYLPGGSPCQVTYAQPGNSATESEILNTCSYCSDWQTSVAMALDAASEPHLVYRCVDVLSHSYRQGAAWTTTAIEIPGITHDPILRSDAQGRLHLLTEYYPADVNKLYYGVYDQGEWSFVSLDSSTGYVSHMEMVPDEDGAAHVVYSSATNRLLHYLTNRSGEWAAFDIELPWPVDTELALAEDSTGLLHLVFGAYYRLWHLPFDPENLPPFFVPVAAER